MAWVSWWTPGKGMVLGPPWLKPKMRAGLGLGWCRDCKRQVRVWATAYFSTRNCLPSWRAARGTVRNGPTGLKTRVLTVWSRCESMGAMSWV